MKNVVVFVTFITLCCFLTAAVEYEDHQSYIDYCLFFLFYRLLLFLPALVLRSNSSSFPS